MNSSMRMTLLFLCFVGFLALAVGAQGQGCSTPPCVSSISIAPNVIPGNGTIATGTVVLNLGQYTNQTNDVGINICCGGVFFGCLPPAVADPGGSTECVGANCKLPQGVNKLEIELWGANGGPSPITAQVQAIVCSINSMSTSFTINPAPLATPVGPDKPDPCPVCSDGGNGNGGPPADGIDPSPTAASGHPINLSNGNTYIQQQDYSLPGGRGGLALGRTWHSMWQALLGTDTGAPAQAGMFGNGWISTYEERLNVHTVNGSNGRKVWSSSGNSSFFSYDATLNHYTPVSPLMLQAGLTFNPGNNTYTFTSHDGTQKIFNQAGFLTSIIDRNNNTTTVAYETACAGATMITGGANRITKVTDPVGRTLCFNYADSNNPNQATSVFDAVGTIATYTYSNGDGGLHRLLSVTYADGTALQFQYNDTNSNTLISAVVDGAGKVIEQHTYDSQRRGLTSSRALVTASSPDTPVEKITVQYSTTVNQVTLINSRSGATTYTFAAFGNQNYLSTASGPGCSTCSVGPADNQITSLYNPDGTLASRTSGRSGNIADFYTYDASQNLASRSQNVLPPILSPSLGIGYQTWQYTYNNFAEVLTATDPLGFVTTYQYDTHGNLTSVTTPRPSPEILPSVTTFAYDAGGTGLVTQITDPNSNVTAIGYTPSTQCTNQSNVGLVATVTNALNKTTKFCYDQRGNRTDVYDALGNHTAFQYDGRNRVTRITYPDSSAVIYAYDATRGRLHTVTDQNSKVTTYDYDDADRLIKVTDAQTPTAGVTQYKYDTEGSLTSITDTLGRITSYVYDANNHVQTVNFPVQGATAPSESYNIDALGNLLSHTDRNGNHTTYAYDSLNRMAQLTGPAGSPQRNYSYDMNNRLTQVTDPTGTYGFTYDNMNRLKQTSTQYSFVTGRTFTVNYTYDAASNRKTMRDAENGLTTYNYDVLNRLQSILDFNGNNFGFGYDDISRRTSLTRPNGVTTNYSYDNLSHLLSVLHQAAGTTTIDGATYLYDNVGNRTDKTDNVGTTIHYSYDDIYQLLQASTQGSDCVIVGHQTICPWVPFENYSYDLVGNRLTFGVLDDTINYTYNNPWNRLDSVSSTSYTYDSNGNTLTKVNGGTTQYTWDFENRLTQVTLPGTAGTATFKYDPFGRRIQKAFTVNSVTTTTNYLYDGETAVEEVDSGGNPIARYVHGPGIDAPLTMTRSGATSFYEQDGGGAPVTSLTNAAGAITDRYTYDSFGNLTGSSGSTINPFRYAAREFDAETGLYYYRARYYDPSAGRFLSEDPIGFDGGTNFYPYVDNDPINFSDPFGEQALPNQPTSPPGPVLVPPKGPQPTSKPDLDKLKDVLTFCMRYPVVCIIAGYLISPGTGGGAHNSEVDWELKNQQRNAECAKKKWRCRVRCALIDLRTGSAVGYVEADGFGNTEADAFYDGQKQLQNSTPRGFRTKHCHSVGCDKL